MDTVKLQQVSDYLSLNSKAEADYQKIFDLINEVSDINSIYLEENLLKIICKGYCNKLVIDANGIYKQIFDEVDYNHRKNYIDLLIQKGINKETKFGRYNAPLLCFVEDKNIFEYLCSIGFNPNERISISGYEGRPYFSLHHDFQIGIYLIAKKYGFDKEQKTLENDEIIHLIFNRFIEFDIHTIESLSKEFESTKNVPMRSGLSCLQKYVLSCDVSNYMIENLSKMLEFGFDKNYKTEKEIETSEFILPKGSTALDIFKIKCENINFDKSLVLKVEHLLQPTDDRDKKKWWKL